MRWLSPTRRLALLGMILNALAVAACGQSYRGGTATEPKSRPDLGFWMKLHEGFLDRAKQGEIDLLFLGDSITQGWADNEVWKRYYSPRRAANFGIGGDRTEHVLWRIENGEIEGIEPKVAVLMIGTNNIGANTPEEIAEGVRAIVDGLRKRLPKTRILLLGVFPRGADRNPDQSEAKLDPRPSQINDIIAKLDDGKTVRYLDISQSFLNENGLIPKSLMPDFLHLSPDGYRRWAEAMEPTLWEMTEE
jgi:lysophospholipase L1-like esterase